MLNDPWRLLLQAPIHHLILNLVYHSLLCRSYLLPSSSPPPHHRRSTIKKEKYWKKPGVFVVVFFGSMSCWDIANISSPPLSLSFYYPFSADTCSSTLGCRVFNNLMEFSPAKSSHVIFFRNLKAKFARNGLQFWKTYVTKWLRFVTWITI